MRGVKPLLTRRRYRVCSGGSIVTIIRRCCSSWSSGVSHKKVPLRYDEKRWASRFTVTQSSWRVMAQKPGPVGLLVPVGRGVGAEVGEPLVGHARHEVAGVGEVDRGREPSGRHLQ